MLKKRLFVWECDGCSLEETKESYGLPLGWTFIIEGEPKHFCRHCAKRLVIAPKTPPQSFPVIKSTGKTITQQEIDDAL